MRKFLPLFTIQNAIREFFNSCDFLDVMTPPVVENPGMEVHIHPFEIKSKFENRDLNLFLHTSPEFHMKELLSYGYDKLFTLTYSFRDEPNSETHRKQFIMLEWYRAHTRYEKIMDDCEELIKYCHQYLTSKNIKSKFDKINFTRMTVDEAFKNFLGFSILKYLDIDSLYEYITNNLNNIPLPPKDNLTWDDLFFLIMLNEIEPHFKKYDFLLLYEFPHHLKALSTLKESDQRVCERFEIYSRGVELCNCFNELTDLEEQKLRFKNQAIEKSQLYNYSLPEANVLYKALERELPPSAGIALGVERLLMSLVEIENPFWD